MPWTPPPAGVEIERRPGPDEELADVLDAAVDVAADVVRVVRLHRRGRMGRAGEDALAKGGRETLDLGLDPGRHAHGGSRRHVAIGPGGAIARRRSRPVPGLVLDEQDEGAIGMSPDSHVRLRGRDFLECPAEVDRSRAAWSFGGPRDGAVQCPIHLKNTRAVPEPLRMAPRMWRQPVARDCDERAGGDVEQDRPSPRQLGEAVHPVGRDDLATQRGQLRDERVGDRSRATARHRPADEMGEDREDESERGTQRAVQPQHRVSGDPGKERLCRRMPKAASGEALGRPQRRQAEPGKPQRVVREMQDRPQELAREIVRTSQEWAEGPAPRPSVMGAEAVLHRGEGPFEHGRRSAVKGCANGASGWRSSTPRAARSTLRKNGEAMVSGKIVEQTSWLNPGRVSSAVRVPPPAVGPAS
jgi:hypothetical protein